MENKEIIFNYFCKVYEIIEAEEKKINRKLTYEERNEIKEKFQEENKELVNTKFNNKYELLKYIKKMLLQEHKIKPLDKLKLNEIGYEIRRRSRINNFNVKEVTKLYLKMIEKLNKENPTIPKYC